MLADFRADLHIHTCLSPCADEMMRPRHIAASAVDNGINIIAVCDHNASNNVRAVRAAAEEVGLSVIGGVEVSSREEVHILGLFDTDEALDELSALIDAHLEGENDVEVFGEQWIADANDTFTGTSDRLLIGATSLTLEQVVDAVHHLGGLAVASHIDREAFGLIGQLGFIPPGLQLDALELSPAAASRRESFSREYDLPLITSSDAHYPEDIGRSVTTFTMERVSIEEMRKALLGEDGRKVVMV